MLFHRAHLVGYRNTTGTHVRTKLVILRHTAVRSKKLAIEHHNAYVTFGMDLFEILLNHNRFTTRVRSVAAEIEVEQRVEVLRVF